MKRVSVVMATCNGASHISAQLESIRNQTLRPHDLWISDDGSSDETLRIISAFAETAPFPVRIWVNTERVGICESVLGLAVLSESDIVALCGQDDVWHPEKLERCASRLQAEDALLCVHTSTLLDARSEYAGYLPQGIDQTRKFAPLTLPPWGEFLAPTLVFRRELLTWIDARERGPDTLVPGMMLRHDRWIYFLAHSLGQVVTMPRPLMGHRLSMATPRGLVGRLRLGRGLPNPRRMIDALQCRQAAAEHRTQLLTTLGRQGHLGKVAKKARAASLYWQRIADILSLRMSLYGAPSFAERRAALNRLVALGAYGGATGRGLRGSALALDALLGLLKFSEPRTPPKAVPARPADQPRPSDRVRLDDHV